MTTSTETWVAGTSLDPTAYTYVDTASGSFAKRNHVMPVADFAPPVGAPECFATWFRFQDDFVTYTAINPNVPPEDRPSVTRYPGPAYTDLVYWDFDAEDDPGKAQTDAVALVERLHRFGIPEPAVRVYFSGKKGFGVEVDAGWFGGFTPSVDLHEQVGRLALALAEGVGTVDESTYQKLRLLRWPNTRHSGSKLFKIPLTVDELRDLDLAAIRALAAEPRTLDVPLVAVEPIPLLVAKWEAALPSSKRSRPKQQGGRQQAGHRRARRDNQQRREAGTSSAWDDLDPDRILRGVREGFRDEVLFRYACRLRRQGRSRGEAETLVLMAAARCDPPFPEEEARRKVDQAWQYDAGAEGGWEDFSSLFKRLRARAQDAPGTVVREVLESADLVAALARAAQQDRREFDALLLWLPEWGVKAGEVKRLEGAVRAAARAKTTKARAPSQEALPRVKATLPDAPVGDDAVVPSGWQLGPGGMGRAGAGDGEIDLIAPAPLLLTGRLIDLTDGTEAVRLAWTRDGHWRQTTVNRALIANARDVVSLADRGVPVTSGSARGVVAYLADYEAANLEHLPRARVTHQLGWQGRDGEHGFLWGRTLIDADGEAEPVDLEAVAATAWQPDWVAFRGQDAGDEQLAAGFQAAGSFEGWLQAVASVADYPRVTLALWTSLAPPLLAILGAPNFIVDWASPTSTGKTTTLRLAASCSGNPDERAPQAAIGTWDATRVWIERAATVRTDLPLILDDTKRAKRPGDVGQILYDVASGRGRGRGSPHGTRRSGTWRTVLLSSGEAPATSFTNDGGTRARTLAVWGKPFGEADATTAPVVHRLNRALLQHYGHAGPRFVAFLLANRESWDDWQAEYRALQAEYLARAGDDPVAGRLVEYLAVLGFTARLAREALGLAGMGEDPVAALLPGLLAEASEADRAARALAYVVGWAMGNQHAFYGRRSSPPLDLTFMGADASDDPFSEAPPPLGWAGRWEAGDAWQSIAFLPPRLGELLERGGFEYDAVLRTWRDRGWLETGEDRKRTTKKVRIDREPTWAIVIRRQAIDELDAG